ncbi:MAG: purine-nucleoside phosphorylase [Thermoleophilia bacterium]|nr:purine-nucleoside phosphorylase [Thermoleophilia bacterium]
MPIHLTTTRAAQSPLALCPGDPDRVRLVAAELLEGARTVTEARGLLGVTGRWRGEPVTVQATGMGGGSTAIVVQELIGLGARSLVRAGTCGGLAPGLAAGSLVVADRARAADGAALALAGPEPPPADPPLTDALAQAAAATGRPLARGTIVSTDLFYDPEPGRPARWAAAGMLAVEMEAAVLFALAPRLGARAGCVCAVSNVLVGHDPGWAGAGRVREAALDACRAGLDALVATR